MEALPHRIWEPCVGKGAIAEVLKAAGHEVIGTDLHDYGIGYPGGVDFLMERSAPPDIDCIVSNPPYMLAQQFVEKALELVPRTCFLLRLAFFESQRRSHILENAGLARFTFSADACRSCTATAGKDRRTAIPEWPLAGSVGTVRILARRPSIESTGPTAAAMRHNRG